MLERIRKTINYLQYQGVIKNDTDLAAKLKYRKSSLSQILNGVVPADKFVEKLCNFDKNINSVWILTGEGSMLKENQHIEISGNNSPSFNVKSPIQITEPQTLDKALDALRESQCHITRLLGIIEKMQS